MYRIYLWKNKITLMEEIKENLNNEEVLAAYRLEDSVLFRL